MSKASNPLNNPDRRSAETQLVHGGTRRTEFNETSEALFLNSGYSYPSSDHAERLFKGEILGAHNYSPFANPTVDVFQARMALPEGAEAARCFAAGMAAIIEAVMSRVRAGDHIVASRALFGGCRFVAEDFMPRFGVSSTLFDDRDPANFAAAMQTNTELVFIETPTNPTLELVDIKAVADIAHAHGAVLIVDSVFATALYQKPLGLGADLVTYSATKHIDGQGRVLGGIVLDSKKLIEGDLHTFLRQTGASLISLDVKGGQEAAFALPDSLAVVLISNNLGDAKSLITHPRTTTHARLNEEARLEVGVTPGLLRLSVELEASDDLIADLLCGLDQV